jgi:hypothetical protein
MTRNPKLSELTTDTIVPQGIEHESERNGEWKKSLRGSSVSAVRRADDSNSSLDPVLDFSVIKSEFMVRAERVIEFFPHNSQLTHCFRAKQL